MNVIQAVPPLASFTVEIGDAARLARVLGVVAEVPGVRSARRR